MDLKNPIFNSEWNKSDVNPSSLATSLRRDSYLNDYVWNNFIL